MAEAHVRIDEGIPRGPRKPRKAPARKQRQNGPYEATKLASVDPGAILKRYLNGETSTEIAQTLGVTRQGLAYFLRCNAEEQWKEAQIVLAVERKEQADEELNNAQDPLSLARAREQLRSAQWDLERVFNRIFGQKQEVKIDVDMRVQVTHALTNKASDLLQSIRGAVQPPMTEPKLVTSEPVDNS